MDHPRVYAHLLATFSRINGPPVHDTATFCAEVKFHGPVAPNVFFRLSALAFVDFDLFDLWTFLFQRQNRLFPDSHGE